MSRTRNKGGMSREKLLRRQRLAYGRVAQRRVDETDGEALLDVVEWQGGDEPERVGAADPVTGEVVGLELEVAETMRGCDSDGEAEEVGG